MECFCSRTSGDWRIFGLNAGRVYGERVSGEEGGLERVSTGGLGPETEINLFGDMMERIVWWIIYNFFL